ncbi:MFS transporter [Psychromonas sp. PT13]|uniref:MFS transporter n=1 Tax=Psychromonas sp. PT13 TaxID=3439547 RepID=UPI003EBAD4F5
MQELSTKGRYTLLFISCLTIMVGCVLAPGLTSISTQMGVADKATWLITLPSLGAVVFAPFAGRLIDRFGAYQSMFIGLFFYGLVGAIGVFFHGDSTVFINRFVLGSITAVVMASGTVLISEWYQGNARLNMIAKQGMSIELGGVIFLFIGGVLAEMGWQWPFLLYLFAWVFLLMLYLYVPPSSPNTLEKTHQPTSEKNDIPQSLITVYLSAGASMIAFFAVIVTLPLQLSTLGFSESETGRFLAFISLVAVLTVIGMPKLLGRIGNNATLIIAFISYSIAHIAFYFSTDIFILIMGTIFAGIGFGLSIPLLNHMTVEQSSVDNRGRNLSYITMAVFSGQFLTSFLEFIPGNSQNVFGFATLFSATYTFYLIIKRDRIKTRLSKEQLQ